MINGYCVNVIAVKTGPVKFDSEHQSKGGENEDNRRVKGFILWELKLALIFFCSLALQLKYI